MIDTDTDWQVEAYAARFTNAYAEAMIWANTTATRNGEATDEEVSPSDWAAPTANWAVEAFTNEAQAALVADCEDFVTANWADLAAIDPVQAGHDFALTRNRHGAGFWDRGLGEVGDRLTTAAHVYGESSGWFDADDDSARISLD